MSLLENIAIIILVTLGIGTFALCFSILVMAFIGIARDFWRNK